MAIMHALKIDTPSKATKVLKRLNGHITTQHMLTTPEREDTEWEERQGERQSDEETQYSIRHQHIGI